jgi:hypothetical protein
MCHCPWTRPSSNHKWVQWKWKECFGMWSVKITAPAMACRKMELRPGGPAQGLRPPWVNAKANTHFRLGRPVGWSRSPFSTYMSLVVRLWPYQEHQGILGGPLSWFMQGQLPL